MFEIQYIIYIYMALCACMMIFNIVYILYNKSSEKFYENENHGISKKINNQFKILQNNERVTVSHMRYLNFMLRGTENLLLFEQCIDKQDKKLVQKYLASVQYVFSELMPYYQKTDGIKKAYFAYIIEKYGISKDINDNVLKNSLYIFLEDESVYCRDYSLKALIKIGNSDDIIRALKKIEETNYYYYPEMILENLKQYKGDSAQLAERLWEKFKEFDENIQISIIRYISEKDLDYTKTFYKLLADEQTNSKIKVELIKYYRENIYGQVKEILIQNLNLIGIENKDIIIKSAVTLQRYGGADTKEALKMLLKRKDWDIRMTASESLILIGTSYYELADIYNGEDEIAREILKYKVQSHKYRLTNKKEAEVS